MPKIAYTHKNFSADVLRVITQANEIITDYNARGFSLTLRQVFYQFVSRGLIENTEKSYKRLGGILSDARMAGLMDWDAIEDRTRNLRENPHWDSPAVIVAACASQFAIDKWATQPYRPEVWIEKDALVGVIEGVCKELDVPHFSCRGYTSISEVWAAGHQRMRKWLKAKQMPVILHFGDHDPSGIDMSRDIRKRLETFSQASVEVVRLALNRDQIDKFKPPPNPAKITDSRAASYIALYGKESWELDALDPEELVRLVRRSLLKLRDQEAWEKAKAEETEQRKGLQAVADHWDTVLDDLRDRDVLE